MTSQKNVSVGREDHSVLLLILVRNLLISFLQRPEKALDVLKEHQGLFLT